MSELILAKRFEANTSGLQHLARGLQDSDWLQRLGAANHALWIAGHVVTYRRFTLRNSGGHVAQAGWEQLFCAGSFPGSELQPHPTQLIEDFAWVGKLLVEQIKTVSFARAPRPFSESFATLEEFLAFMLWHESYHLGQISLIRQACKALAASATR